MESHFTEKGMQMTLTCVKICSNLLIREKQTKAILRSDWQKSRSLTTSVQGCEAVGPVILCWRECNVVQPQWRGVWQSQQDDVRVASAIRKISGSSPKGMLAKIRKDSFTKMGKVYIRSSGMP